MFSRNPPKEEGEKEEGGQDDVAPEEDHQAPTRATQNFTKTAGGDHQAPKGGETAEKHPADENGGDGEKREGEDGDSDDEVKTHGKRGGIWSSFKSLFTSIDPKIDVQSNVQGLMTDMQLPEGVDKGQLLKAVQTSQHAEGLQGMATSLRQKAAKVRDPKERQRMLQESYDREIEAHGQSKMARRMQSGAWQGAAGGAGIGGGVGVGLGTVVGTLVGGVVSLPTTALGGLIGAGVGGIHGPFLKFDSNKKEGGGGKTEVTPQVPKAKRGPVPRAIPPSDAPPADSEEALEGAVGQGAQNPPDEVTATPKRKPRKLERRSGAEKASVIEDAQPGDTSPRAVDPNKPRKKPKKLEVRSGNRNGGNEG